MSNWRWCMVLVRTRCSSFFLVPRTDPKLGVCSTFFSFECCVVGTRFQQQRVFVVCSFRSTTVHFTRCPPLFLFILLSCCPCLIVIRFCTTKCINPLRHGDKEWGIELHSCSAHAHFLRSNELFLWPSSYPDPLFLLLSIIDLGTIPLNRWAHSLSSSWGRLPLSLSLFYFP